jgi:hypothetical protein
VIDNYDDIRFYDFMMINNISKCRYKITTFGGVIFFMQFKDILIDLVFVYEVKNLYYHNTEIIEESTTKVTITYDNDENTVNKGVS